HALQRLGQVRVQWGACRPRSKPVKLAENVVAVRVDRVARVARRSRGLAESYRKAGHPGGTEIGVVELHDGAYVARVRCLDPFLDSARPADRRSGPVADLFPLRRAPGEEEIAQPGVQALVDLRLEVLVEVEKLCAFDGQAGRAGEPGQVARA